MIDVSTHDGIHTLRLSRPPANALDPALLHALTDAVEAAPPAGARGLVLAGGRGIFSAGLDVPQLLTLDRDGIHTAWSAFLGAARALARCPVPVAAAIAGHSPAGGCVLALCCDYRVMAVADADASPFRIGLNEVQVGVPVPDAIQHLLRRTVGPRQAEKLLVTGAMPDTRAALGLGLVDEAVPMDEVEPRAQAWLQTLFALPQHAVRATRDVARADLVAAMTDPAGTAVEPFVDAWFAEPTQAALKAMVARLRR